MPTGGGPKPPSPTPLEQTLLTQSSLEGGPSLQGLSEGFDTGGNAFGIFKTNKKDKLS